MVLHALPEDDLLAAMVELLYCFLAKEIGITQKERKAAGKFRGKGEGKRRFLPFFFDKLGRANACMDTVLGNRRELLEKFADIRFGKRNGRFLFGGRLLSGNVRVVEMLQADVMDAEYQGIVFQKINALVQAFGEFALLERGEAGMFRFFLEKLLEGGKLLPRQGRAAAFGI